MELLELSLPRRSLALLLTLVALGCKGGALTDADPKDNLGQQIVAAIAKVAGEPPPPGYPLSYLRGVRPLNLSEVAIVDSWNWGTVSHSHLAAELAKYVEGGGFPGTVIHCDPDPGSKSEQACFPLSRDDLPPEGILILSIPRGDRTTEVGVGHFYFTASGEFDWHTYVVEMERLGSGWKVGKGGYSCCS